MIFSNTAERHVELCAGSINGVSTSFALNQSPFRMQVAERRISRRYSISDDRSKCMAIVGKREHRAILSDTSASGFGLMLLSGVSIESDQLRLVTNDGIHDCRIAYIRREESFQHLGVERLADVSLIEMPRRGKRRAAFGSGMEGSSPFLFLGVILRLVSMAAVVLLGMDMSSNDDGETVIIIDQTPQPTFKDREALRKKASRAPNQSVRVIDSYFDELSFEQRVSFNSTVTQANLSWDDLVSGLKLTRK